MTDWREECQALSDENERLRSRLERCRSAWQKFQYESNVGDSVFLTARDVLRAELESAVEEPLTIKRAPIYPAPEHMGPVPTRKVSLEEMREMYPAVEERGTPALDDWSAAKERIRRGESAVEARWKCLDCDAPIPEPGYCAPCIEKMRELIDPPAIKDRGPHANTCASLMGIDCDCSLSFEQKSVVEKNGPPAECNCLPFVCMQECLPPDTACREETKRVSEERFTDGTEASKT